MACVGSDSMDNVLNGPELDRKFNELDSVHQAVVYFSALSCCELTMTAMLKCLSMGKILKSGGRYFTAPDLLPVLEKLHDDGFIVYSEKRIMSGYLFTARAMSMAADRDLLTPLTDVMYMYGLQLGASYNDYIVRAVRTAWWALWFGETSLLRKLPSEIRGEGELAIPNNSPLFCFFSHPDNLSLILRFDHSVQRFILREILLVANLCCAPVQEAFLRFEELCLTGEPDNEDLECLFECWLARGMLGAAENYLKNRSGLTISFMLGCLGFLRKSPDHGLSYFRETTRPRKMLMPPLMSLYYLAALYLDSSARSETEALSYIALLEKHWLNDEIPCNSVWRWLFENKRKRVKTRIFSSGYWDTYFSQWFYGLGLIWDKVGGPVDVDFAAIISKAWDSGFRLLAGELTHVLSQHDQIYNTTFLKPEFHNILAENKENGILSYASNLLENETEWSRLMKMLIEYKPLEKRKLEGGGDESTRLIWLVGIRFGELNVFPKEQKRSAKGVWSKGRDVSPKRLFKIKEHTTWLSQADLKACNTIQSSYTRSGFIYFFDSDLIADALIGHPLLFRQENPKISVTLERGEPELKVIQEDDFYRLELLPEELAEKAGSSVVFEAERNCFKVVDLRGDLQVIADILSQPIRVPSEGKDFVKQAVENLSHMITVHSEADVTSLDMEPCEIKPHIHLLPLGDGLEVRLRVQPHGEGGPFFKPGQGAEHVIAHIEGKPKQTSRNFHGEIQQALLLQNYCPVLTDTISGRWDWFIKAPHDCLQLLESLEAYGNDHVVSWPEGVTYSISGVKEDHFKFSIKEEGNWFEATGKLMVDEDLTLQFKELLDLVSQSTGRFLPLGGKRYLSLTNRFRNLLEHLSGCVSYTGKKVKMAPVSAMVVGELAEELPNLKADKKWIDLVKRQREGETCVFSVPSTLQAQLRDYQLEGFQWLSRLAHWGVGACLADDMGLGKTIQALACILTRAQDGPSLVVAPTSVVDNWVQEIRRFAPTLNPKLLSAFKDRGEGLASLEPFDLLICTYGLLQQEATLLAEVQWNTAILDEAQIIKNPSTKRAKAAMNLSASFRIITTGTPIENHLGELWSLFRFINPGLLGTRQQFNARFAAPVEKKGDTFRRQILKKLVRPFILRRLKSDVLDELPPKTETSLFVELSKEEASLYEAIRQKALKDLAEEQQGSQPGATKILAQLTRLRRMCCHPKLAHPHSQLPGSKLKLMGEILDDLLENQHKTLIFSQFVDHLIIIREYLDQRGIEYQYLDGATSPKKRRDAINAFQAGEGDVFLISLRAGGVGLNLTAADYIIHMDPWWNPAVEDQASDRAHRLGQQRPVTVYRLITRNTIEEKIIALHKKKRDMAEALLEGGEAAGRMTASALLALIRED